MYGYIYKTTNLINNKIYIGMEEKTSKLRLLNGVKLRKNYPTENNIGYLI